MSINQHFVEKLRRNDEILTDLIDYIVRFTYNEEEFIHNNLEDGRTISMIGERNFVVPIIDDWVKTSEVAISFHLVNVSSSNLVKVSKVSEYASTFN